GDHVTLVLGRDVVDVEDRHGLRPGLHGLVAVLAGDAGDGRGLLATGESTTLTGAVVAHGAVDAEDLPALAGAALLGVGVLLGRTGVAGAEGGAIGDDVGDLLVGELDVQVIGRLVARLGQRHMTGAHLEVHCGGADTGEARAETVDAHTVRAV